jgi:succinyl-CoA synthetase beta subunit
VLDRSTQGPAFIVSKHGGMDIEDVANTDPQSIIVEPVDITKGLTNDQASKILKKLEVDPKQHADATEQMKNLYNMFVKLDNV